VPFEGQQGRILAADMLIGPERGRGVTLAQSGPDQKEARMGVKVREKLKNSGIWWIFIDHQGRRKAKKIGRDIGTA